MSGWLWGLALGAVLAVSGCGVWLDEANDEDRERLERLLADPVWELAPPGMTVADSRAGAPTGELTTGTGKGEVPVNSAFAVYDLPAEVDASDVLSLYYRYVVENGWSEPSGGCQGSAVGFSTAIQEAGYVLSLSVTFRTETRVLTLTLRAPHHRRDGQMPDIGEASGEGVECLVDLGLLVGSAA